MAKRKVELIIQGRDVGTRKMFAGINRGLSGISSRLKGLALGFGAFFGGRAIIGKFNEMRESIDRVAKTSDKLGISTDALMGLQHAAGLSGVKVATMEMALQRMVRRVNEASHGTGEAQDAIKELGIDAEHLGQQTPDQQLGILADALNRTASQGDKVRLAFKLFDSEGVSMIQMLKGGKAGLDKMMQGARDLGGTMKSDAAAEVEKANDALNRMKLLFNGVAQRMTVKFAPIMVMVIEKIVTGFTFLETVFKNWSLSWSIAGDLFLLILIGLWEDLKHTFTVRIPALLEFFMDNWKDIFQTLWNFTKTIFANMFTNVTGFFKSIWSWLKGDGFDFEWTGLLDGFESTLKKLPAIADRELTAMEKEIQIRVGTNANRIADQFTEKLSARMAALTSIAAPAGDEVAGDSSKSTGGEGSAGKGLSTTESRFLTGARTGPAGQNPQVITAKATVNHLKLAKEQSSRDKIRLTLEQKNTAALEKMAAPDTGQVVDI